MNTVLSVQVSLFHVSGLPSIPSPTTPPSPLSLSHTTPQRSRLPFPVLSRRARNSRKGLGFAIDSQAHRNGQAEAGSLYYGLLIHLLLLPTPPRGDAVTIGYRPECVYLKRTCTSLAKYAYRRTNLAPVGLPAIRWIRYPGLTRPGLSNPAPVGLIGRARRRHVTAPPSVPA